MFVEDEDVQLQLKIEDKLRASVKINPAIKPLQFIGVEVNFRFHCIRRETDSCFRL